MTVAISIYRLKRSFLRWIKQKMTRGEISVKTSDDRTYYWIRTVRYPKEMADGSYEMDILAALKKLLNSGDTFIDIGANAGYWCLQAKMIVGNGRVFAVEPNPENIKMIEKVKTANPNLPFDCLPIAISDQNGEIAFSITYNNANSRISETIWELAKPESKRIIVQSRNVDWLLETLKPHVIKIDVEGAEAMILEAVNKENILKYKPAMLIEFHGAMQMQRCKIALARWGYIITNINSEMTDEEALHAVAVFGSV
jgi:FkbM family methyltransferase